MKTAYIIQRPAGQMTDKEAKKANVIERVIIKTLKYLLGSVLAIIIAGLLVILCIGFQEMPDRYDKAMAMFEKRQMLNEKFKASSSNE